jgi:hypothetical protein
VPHKAQQRRVASPEEKKGNGEPIKRTNGFDVPEDAKEVKYLLGRRKVGQVVDNKDTAAIPLRGGGR